MIEILSEGSGWDEWYNSELQRTYYSYKDKDGNELGYYYFVDNDGDGYYSAEIKTRSGWKSKSFRSKDDAAKWIVNKSRLKESMTGWETFYSDGITTHAFFNSNGMEMGGYYEDPNDPDTIHAYLRSGDRSGDRMDFSNTYDAIGWVENDGEIDFDDEEVYESGIPGGRYWEPGWEDANDEEFIDDDKDDNYDEDPPFESNKRVNESKLKDFNKRSKNVSNLTVGDLRRMDLWDEDRIVIVDSNGDVKDVSRVLVDEDYGYLYIQ